MRPYNGKDIPGLGDKTLAQAQKRCPICETQNPKKAAYCMNCGASLTHAEVEVREPSRTNRQGYDFRYGETDLSEDGLRGKARLYLLIILSIFIIALVMIVVFWVRPTFIAPATPTITPSPTLDITLTPSPTLSLATVTQGPPTLTPTQTPSPTLTPGPTNTPEPCLQTVGAGEGMLALISRCGHINLDVIPLVVQMNGLSDENDLRAGQTIQIPYPTPTIDPNAIPATLDPAAESNTGESVMVSLDGGMSQSDIEATQAIDPFFVPTPTNPPGVANYTVVLNDSIIGIIAQYNTTIDIIDKLNPEMDFFQCEMGQQFGGPACVVPLFEGQLIRVPVPSPTPTFTFTPNGSETPTPTATATYNAPNPLSPSNRAYFRRDEVITLRWSASGTLADNEVYFVTVQNLGEGVAFTGETRDLFWVVPQAWQGAQAAQLEYIWTVSIITQGNPNSARYTTLPLGFTWEGRGEES